MLAARNQEIKDKIDNIVTKIQSLLERVEETETCVEQVEG